MSVMPYKSAMGAAMTPRDIFGYHVISEIGKGAASTIYAVSDAASGQVYALKHVLRKTDKEQRFIEQVQNEFEVSKICKHPVLRKVVDLKTVKKFFGPITEVALIMELIDGIPLDEKPLTGVKLILMDFIKVAEALWEVNKAGYVHCDTKPGNIMITGDGTVRLIDLGQACKIGTAKERVQGTPSFIAPEQARCKGLSEQTDVYNFGATLYWALTGRRVPTIMTVEKADRQMVKEQSYPSPGELNDQVPPRLSELVMHCLRHRPWERPTDMGSVLMRLEDCLIAMKD
jgi:serine/threonine protein kinase